MSEAAAPVQVALARVMAELPAIGKERHQGDGIQYAYRGIEQVTREVQTLFARHGVVIVPHVDAIEVREIVVNGKPWTDTQLVVSYAVVGPDGSTLTACCVGIGRDNSDKGANKAMTQAFKYLLLQLLCISDAKDDTDGATVEADGRTKPRQRVAAPDVSPPPAGASSDAPTQAQTRKAMALFGEHGLSAKPDRLAFTSDVLGREVASWADVTKREAVVVIDALEHGPRST